MQLITEINTNIVDNSFRYNYLLIAITGIIFAMLLYLIFINFKNDRYKLILFVLIGIATQMMMIFSPTIYVSLFRTGIFMYFTFIIFNIYCAKEIIEKNSLSHENILFTMLALFDFINFLNE